MKKFKLIALFLLLHSALCAASMCSSRDFVNSFKDGVLRSGANGYCQGNTFYIVSQVYSQSDFEALPQNLRNSSNLFASVCSLFDETLRMVNSLNNTNLRGNLVYVFEYGGQKIQYSCQ